MPEAPLIIPIPPHLPGVSGTRVGHRLLHGLIKVVPTWKSDPHAFILVFGRLRRFESINQAIGVVEYGLRMENAIFWFIFTETEPYRMDNNEVGEHFSHVLRATNLNPH